MLYDFDRMIVIVGDWVLNSGPSESTRRVVIYTLSTHALTL